MPSFVGRSTGASDELQRTGRSSRVGAASNQPHFGDHYPQRPAKQPIFEGMRKEEQRIQLSRGSSVEEWRVCLVGGEGEELIKERQMFGYNICGVAMGNGEFEVPATVSEEWVELGRGGRRQFANRITSEQFELLVVSRLEEPQNISQLIERSIYALPRTPKVIILNDKLGEICLLVQLHDHALPHRLAQLYLLTDLLQLLRDLTLTVAALCSKYGYFQFTEAMVGFNRNQQIIAWVNEAKHKTEVQRALPHCDFPEQVMLREIIAMCRKHAQLPLPFQLLDYPPKYFSAFLAGLTEIIDREKLRMAQNYLKTNPYDPQPKINIREPVMHRRLAAQQSCKTLSLVPLRSPAKYDSSPKPKKRNGIPNFIKGIKDKKNNLLDSLNHRRTFTIEEAESIKQQKLHHQNKMAAGNNSTSIDRVRSLKGSPTKKDRGSNFSYGELSKISNNPSNAETGEHLTSSGSSSNYMIKRRDFSDKGGEKGTPTLKSPKAKGGFQPNSTTGKSSYFKSSEESILFRSFQKLPASLLPPTALVTLCPNTTESKFFNDQNQDKSVIREIEEESHMHSKTIEEELNDFFSNPARSPRNTFDSGHQSRELQEQFGQIMNQPL